MQLEIQTGSGSITVPIINLGAGWGCVVNAKFHPRRGHSTHFTRVWVGSRAGPDGCTHRDSNREPPSPYRVVRRKMCWSVCYFTTLQVTQRRPAARGGPIVSEGVDRMQWREAVVRFQVLADS